MVIGKNGYGVLYLTNTRPSHSAAETGTWGMEPTHWAS